jgi:serine/threonine protein kinase
MLTGLYARYCFAGKKFNQVYMLAHELGSGAFSVVRLGVVKATGQNTAVKIINKKKFYEEDISSLSSEIEILGSLDHPHIIKYVSRNNLDL